MPTVAPRRRLQKVRPPWIVSALLSILAIQGCGGGSSTSTVSPTPPPPTPPAVSVCATPSAANPTGGGGTFTSIGIDLNVYGSADVSGLTVFGFSQQGMGSPDDPQIMQMLPDVLPRAWARWDTYGVKASDYNFDYPADAEAKGITFVGGTTATVMFADEFSTAAQLNTVVSCNAQGQPVLHAPLNYYRGSMASPAYRKYILGIAALQIDGGANGVFFDEIDESYEGATYGNGNEGFDDADVADFGGFLCGKYPNLTSAQWQTQFSILPADKLDCTLSLSLRGRGFNYRGYLLRNGWQSSPLIAANPLTSEWGTLISGHPEPKNGTFVGSYVSLVYWQDLVLQLRNYARQKYKREIYITANGIFPFVDFQMNGLWDGNPDGPNGSEVDYVPVTGDGHLDGSVSLLPAFLGLKQRSARIAPRPDGRTVPVAAFIDWPTGPMTRYLALPFTEQQDYWRMYAPEAYAATVYLNFHLQDTIGDPTAQQLGLMPLFDQLRAFYKAHAALYHGTQDLTGNITVSAQNVATNLTQLAAGGTVAHLVNHNYAQGFQEQDGVTVSFPMNQVPASVTLVSPDITSDVPVAFTYAGGQVTVTVPKLVAYVALVAR